MKSRRARYDRKRMNYKGIVGTSLVSARGNIVEINATESVYSRDVTMNEKPARDGKTKFSRVVDGRSIECTCKGNILPQGMLAFLTCKSRACSHCEEMLENVSARGENHPGCYTSRVLWLERKFS